VNRRTMMMSLATSVAALGLRRFSAAACDHEHPLNFYVGCQNHDFALDGEMSCLDEYAVVYEDVPGELPPLALRLDADGLLLRTAFLSAPAREFVLCRWRWTSVPEDGQVLRPAVPLTPDGTIRLAGAIRRRLREHLCLDRIDLDPAQIDEAVAPVIARVESIGCLDRTGTSPFDHVAARTGGSHATWSASGWLHSSSRSTAAHRRLRGSLERSGAIVVTDYDGEEHCLSARNVTSDAYVSAITEIAPS
jgi:hypothetical protein